MFGHEASIRVLWICLAYALTQQQAAGGHLPAADQSKDRGYCTGESKRTDCCEPSSDSELHANILYQRVLEQGLLWRIPARMPVTARC